jgi:DMSO/TMAO reductase YedYZ molybdopterin-dependent catalytic subunit
MRLRLASVPIARRCLWLCLFWLALPFSAARAQAELAITGDVKTPLTLDLAALRAFPADAHMTYRHTADMSDQGRPFSEVRGVRLVLLLQQAGLAARDRLDWRKTVVIVSARDGSRVVFSWPELAYTEAGNDVMVAYERDRAALPAPDGPLAVHAPRDERAVARDVKQVQRIEMRILRD